MPHSIHIVLAGGGTAGHLFPGVAVAEELRRVFRDLRITFAATGKAPESDRLRAAGFDSIDLPSEPFPRRARDAWPFVAANLAGYYAARRLLRDEKVGLVVGLGGYASVPMARAAVRLGVPLVLLEQNAYPGRATRWLAPAASLVCAAWDEVRIHMPSGSRLRVTGNPIHSDFQLLGAPLRPTHLTRPAGDRRRLLVLGGSSGARTLNEQVPLALYKLGPQIKPWHIIHQTGPADTDATRELYRKLGIAATVTPFIRNMARALAHTDLAISRAGGTTLAELAAAGVPAVLLPYPHATDDHQRRNAAVLVAAGGCKLLDQREVTGRLDHELAASLEPLVTDSLYRARLAKAMLRQGRPQAAAAVVAAIGDVIPLDAHREVFRAA